MTENIPSDLKYLETHEWIKVDGNTATVGITDHAQHELSDVVYVEPPKVGAPAKMKGTIAVVESVKAASDIYSPVSGEIIEVNPELQSNPALVNQDPYGKGWIYKIKLSSPGEVKELLDASSYGRLIGH
jgi:glycine cleavage system H protein